MKSLLLFVLLTFSIKTYAEEFPLNIFTAEYYYTFFTSNLKYKLEKLHDQFPNRKLTTYWQYAVTDKCETLYSHAIIPQIIEANKKLSILLNITECGTPIKWFRFDYTLINQKLTSSDIQQIKKDLVKFQLPSVDWIKFKDIQIATEEDYFFWTENVLLAQEKNEYNTYEVKISHSHFVLNNIKQNHLKLEYSKFKNEHLVNSKTLLVSYQPANEDHFPQIQYYNETGSVISTKAFISDYKHYITSTLNDLILEVTDITPQTFGIFNMHN